ncbi:MULTISPECIES: AlpA family transcriptional regulator [unclassified Thioalkalivibrio]|uniref:helix-turn-helix transcriptional regulator n=1 Tax=unclassified Thioalkalivibrio TaxID=2621013 RepID=UPI000375D6DE|nr:MULTISPECIES: DNA-binding protein [unclassified Thioalkalivibrio]
MKWTELDDDQHLTTDQLASWLNVSKSQLNKARMAPGKGPEFVRIGTAVRYRVGTVRTWLQEKEQHSIRSHFMLDMDDSELPPPEVVDEWLS